LASPASPKRALKSRIGPSARHHVGTFAGLAAVHHVDLGCQFGSGGQHPFQSSNSRTPISMRANMSAGPSLSLPDRDDPWLKPVNGLGHDHDGPSGMIWHLFQPMA